MLCHFVRQMFPQYLFSLTYYPTPFKIKIISQISFIPDTIAFTWLQLHCSKCGMWCPNTLSAIQWLYDLQIKTTWRLTLIWMSWRTTCMLFKQGMFVFIHQSILYLLRRWTIHNLFKFLKSLQHLMSNLLRLQDRSLSFQSRNFIVKFQTNSIMYSNLFNFSFQHNLYDVKGKFTDLNFVEHISVHYICPKLQQESWHLHRMFIYDILIFILGSCPDGIL